MRTGFDDAERTQFNIENNLSQLYKRTGDDLVHHEMQDVQ